MSEDTKHVRTLEQLIYDVRHNVGEIKDHLIATLATGPSPGMLTNYKLTTHLDKHYLARMQDEIHHTILEILEDPLIQNYDDPAVREQAVAKVEEMAQAAVRIAFGMDFNELVRLSKLGIELYETIKPFADEARTMDHQTGLRVSSYLEEKMFDYMKDYIAHPDRHIAIANIDLNKFKDSNDIVGKEQTDEVIRQLARIMKELPKGLVIRRTEERGDEFYILFHADSEGAHRIIEKRLFPSIETELIPYLKEACEQKLIGDYNHAFEDRGLKYTCAVGVSATHMPGKPNIFARASATINGDGNGAKKQLKHALDNLYTADPDDRQRVYERLPADMRRKVLLALRQTLFDESEKAMKLSKNRDHDSNIVSVYDPDLAKDKYVYVSERD